MVAARKIIKVTSETTLPDVLHDAEVSPVVLERDGQHFVLALDTGIDYEPDGDAVRTMLAEVAGSWAHLDIDEMIRGIYEAREQGSRGYDRP